MTVFQLTPLESAFTPPYIQGLSPVSSICPRKLCPLLDNGDFEWLASMTGLLRQLLKL